MRYRVSGRVKRVHGLRLRRRTGERQGRAGLWVVEGQAVRPQGDGPRRVVRAVLAVAGQGKAPGGELYADLVGAAGVQSDTHQRQTIGGVHGAVGQAGLPCVGGGGARHIGQAALGIPGQQVGQLGGGPGRRTAQDGQILLGEAVVAQLPGQQGRGRAAAGKDHDAGYLCVQPVNGTDAVGVQPGAEQLRPCPPGSSVDSTPAGLTATTIRASS